MKARRPSPDDESAGTKGTKGEPKAPVQSGKVVGGNGTKDVRRMRYKTGDHCDQTHRPWRGPKGRALVRRSRGAGEEKTLVFRRLVLLLRFLQPILVISCSSGS